MLAVHSYFVNYILTHVEPFSLFLGHRDITTYPDVKSTDKTVKISVLLIFINVENQNFHPNVNYLIFNLHTITLIFFVFSIFSFINTKYNCKSLRTYLL